MTVESVGDKAASGDDQHVRTLAKDVALAKLELRALGVDVADGLAVATEVVDAGQASAGLDDPGHLHGVSDVEDAGVRNRAHDGDVLEGGVGATVGSDGETGVGAVHVDGVVSIGAREENLVERTTRDERREGVDERDVALGGHAGGNAHHVGLGDAALDEVVRVGGLDLQGVGGAAKVGLEHDDLVVLGNEALEGLHDHVAQVSAGSAAIFSELEH